MDLKNFKPYTCFTHNKSGEKYLYQRLIGLKVFGFWFYFVEYSIYKKELELTFYRTYRDFHKKFTLKN